MNCYRKLGSPVVVNSAVLHCAALIGCVYDLCPCGGRAHIVLDDWNLEDDNIAFCLGWDDPDETQEENVACVAALQAMRSLSIPERATALALHDGFIP